MPEAFAILFVMLAAAGVYVGAFFYARNPANHNPRLERDRLQNHEVWLRERLERAKRENWSGDMVASLAAELGSTSQQLAKVTAQN